MAATFLLLTVLVQTATAMTARSAADAAVSAATRRSALPGADIAAEASRLQQTLEAIVPGAGLVTVDIRVRSRSVVGIASIRWSPPGPVLVPITITLRAEVPVAFAP